MTNLYSLKGDLLEQLEPDAFKLERNIQKLVEKNLGVLFGLQFVDSEFSIENYRFDTLAYDERENAFVILEYKRGFNHLMVDQGLSYLAVLRASPAGCVLAYQNRFDRALKKVNWLSSRAIFISQSFHKFQSNGIAIRDSSLELWKIKKYNNDLVSLESLRPETKKPIPVPPSIPTPPSGEGGTRMPQEVDFLERCSVETRSLWGSLKTKLEFIGDGEMGYVKYYAYLKNGSKVAVRVRPGKTHLLLEIFRGYRYPDGGKSKGYFTVADPKRRLKKGSYRLANGNKGDLYCLEVGGKSQIGYAVAIVAQKFASIGSSRKGDKKPRSSQGKDLKVHSEKTRRIWRKLNSKLKVLGEIRHKERYAVLKKGHREIIAINMRRDYCQIKMYRGIQHRNGEKAKGYLTINDPKGILGKTEYEKKNGEQGHFYVLNVREESEVNDYIISLISQKIEFLNSGK